MDLDGTIKLINATALLIQALSLPLVVFFVIGYFGTPLNKLLEDVGEFSFKAGTSGLEATARRRQFEAVAFLGAAAVNKGSIPQTGSQVPAEEEVREIANVVSKAVRPRAVRRLAEVSVLWVDDNPSNNLYERKALETLGIRFTISTSTQDALEKIRLNKYDAIVSDMGRGPDDRAGYTLLLEKQKIGDTTPFITYAGSNLPEHRAEARERGAVGSTDNPQELFQLVLSILQNNRDGMLLQH